MDKLSINWREVQPYIGPLFHKGVVGKWRLFTISMSMVERGKFTLTHPLPGVKGNLTCSSVKEAKEIAESVLSVWIEGLKEIK